MQDRALSDDSLASVMPFALPGLASDRQRFAEATHATAAATGLEVGQVVHDYWLVRALHGVRSVLLEDGEVVVPARKARQPDRRVGRWAFGGGTSLTAAWRVAERYSEDIDGSLFAIHSGIDLSAEHPEIGGFRIACVRPEWTAANKLDAMHRRAATGDLQGMVDRGRDLYDLWALAVSEHADAIRERVPQLGQRAAAGMRTPVPRPDEGYGASPAFKLGTDANTALREGFVNAIELTVWGAVPTFEDAIAATRELDTV